MKYLLALATLALSLSLNAQLTITAANDLMWLNPNPLPEIDSFVLKLTQGTITVRSINVPSSKVNITNSVAGLTLFSGVASGGYVLSAQTLGTNGLWSDIVTTNLVWDSRKKPKPPNGWGTK